LVIRESTLLNFVYHKSNICLLTCFHSVGFSLH
jgi:hypothetical protein